MFSPSQLCLNLPILVAPGYGVLLDSAAIDWLWAQGLYSLFFREVLDVWCIIICDLFLCNFERDMYTHCTQDMIHPCPSCYNHSATFKPSFWGVNLQHVKSQKGIVNMYEIRMKLVTGSRPWLSQHKLPVLTRWPRAASPDQPWPLTCLLVWRDKILKQ